MMGMTPRTLSLFIQNEEVAEPKFFCQAVVSNKWVQGINEGHVRHVLTRNMNTFCRPHNKNVIVSLWVYRIKFKSGGVLTVTMFSLLLKVSF